MNVQTLEVMIDNKYLQTKCIIVSNFHLTLAAHIDCAQPRVFDKPEFPIACR